MLREIIETHVSLDRPTSQGWHNVLCKICGDHGHKGKRAAFRFDGDSVVYNCFNCQFVAGFDPNESKYLSKKMEEVLLAYGVTEDEINRLKFSLLEKKHEHGSSEKKQITTAHEPKELTLPTHFKTLDYDSVWCDVAREYLSERLIDPKSYPFMISTGVYEDLTKHPKEVQVRMAIEAKKWVGRVIIPIYKNNKLIFFTGRDMTDSKVKKYESPSSPKHNVLFGFDRLFEHTDSPLYVMEGIMDAFIVDGVAVLGNKLSESHLYWLNRSNRRKVYIPDRFGDGQIAANQAHAQGWEISCPDFGDEKDVSSAAQKYGKLYVLSELSKKTFKGFAAELNIASYCKK
jgi:hypothetical protein